MNKIISPLRYPGGKGMLATFLGNVILYNGIEGCNYYEPYAGGAGAALQLLQSGIVKKVYLNDADKSIYAFWNSILHETERFIYKIKEIKVNIDEWEKQKKIYQNENDDLFSLGFAAFYLNRCNRSGIIKSGGPIGGNHQNGKWKIDVRFNKETLIRRINKIAQLSDRIKYTNYNAKRVLSTIGENVFIYIDPPYYQKGKCLYLNSHTENDHKDLATILDKIDKHKWVLTYDDCLFIRKLYENNRIFKFSLNYSLQNKRKGSELLIIPSSLLLPSQININGKYQHYEAI